MKENFEYPAVGTLPTAETNNKSLALPTLGSLKQLRSSKSRLRIEKYKKLYGVVSRPTTSKSDVKLSAWNKNQHEISEAEIKPSSASQPRFSLKLRYLQLTSETPKHDNADNLKKRLNDLLYTIQKATSDKLEMIRDTSTYEYNFAQANELTVQLARMRITAKSLPELESLIDGTFSENSTCEKIEKCLNAIISLENLPETHYEPEIEKYNIRKCFKVNKLDTVFQGVISVSGHNCMTNIRSDQWLEILDISLTTFTRQNFHLNLKLTISNTYQEPWQLVNTIKANIIPFLYLIKTPKGWKLLYDSRHSISFYSIVLKIRGYGLCSVQLSESGDDHIHLQADFDEDALEVLREEFTYEGSIFLEPISRLKRVISQHLCYIKKSRSLYWQQDYFPNFIFSLKEDNSKFLNEDYLTEILDIDNFVKLYMFSVDVKSKRFDIDVCANKSHIMLRVKSERDIVEIAEDSKYFRLLTDLQILNIEKGPITVKKSLELEIFILKLFPRHFMTINNV